MFKLLKKLRKVDWALIVIILGLTVLQVYCVMNMTDYISGIMTAITYINYQNHPELISMGSFNLGAIIPSQMSWAQFDSALSNPSQFPMIPSDQLATIQPIVHNIAIATVNDIWFNGGMIILNAVGYVLVQMVICTLASIIAASFATRVRSEINSKVSSMSLNNINSFSIP